MIKEIDFHIKELEDMKKYPEKLFYIGNTNLLQKKKVSIVGSRSPNRYAKELTYKLSTKLSNAGICIVSGGAMGIDTIAHNGASTSNTIMVSGTGLDKRYPAINKKLIEDIEKNGLVLSQFNMGTPSTRYNFPLRNEVVVALGDVLIVSYADINSGTMRSVEYALKMGKEIYVLPHRIDESAGTNELLRKDLAKAIYDIDEFVSKFEDTLPKEKNGDEFLIYCKSNPSYDEAVSKYSSKVFEYELLGNIIVKNGTIFPA